MDKNGVLVNVYESHTDFIWAYAQENPDFEEHPERAPAGIGLLWVGWLLIAEIIFLMFGLLQYLQVRLSTAEEIITRLSKFLPQSSQ